MLPEKPLVEPATPELAAKDTFRILILDEMVNVLQLKAACKNAGHSVVPAHTVKEAMSFLDGPNHADVIICAAYLEDENIFEFLKRLRGDAKHDDSMFMILSLAPGPIGVRLNASVEIAGHHLGSDAFISMPVFDAVQLIAAIKALLPVVPWLERCRIEDQAEKKSLAELEALKQKFAQEIDEAERRIGNAADLPPELVTVKIVVKCVEELIEHARTERV
ncbi:MAG: response regulator [Candidatus Melainabacteria bacterium]|nr:response regulator [Candidatus Melainabacteria bacterium]